MNELVNSQEITSLILKDFMLEPTQSQMNEAEMIDYLADAIAYMMEHKMDYLLSLLYRLDVAEEQINQALRPAQVLPANFALAQLVWARQKQRILTKKMFRQQNSDNWDWDDDI